METKTLVVNGIPRQVLVDSDTLLVDVLRNQLQITSVKVGCGQGQCGACSVILDGKVTRACIVKMRRVPDHAQVTTLEGVGTPANLHPLQESWMFHGAAQCGFCTPGFIVSAKALLDSNPAPSREEVRDWFQKHHNICRCTGYKPLVDAVMDAAAVMRGDKDIEELRYKLPADGRAFGSRLPRPSALVKVTGLAEYGADAAVHMPPDTLHLALAQAKVSHALIKGIDTSEAEKMPGVVRVLTHKDVKGKNRITGLITFADNKGDGWDRPILNDTKVFQYGDALAIVCADSEAHARAAADKVKFDLELLPEYMSAPEAMAPDAIEIHPGTPNIYYEPHIEKGEDTKPFFDDPENVVVEDSFYTQRQPHLNIEPDVGYGYLNEQGQLVIHSKSIGLHLHALMIAPGLGVKFPEELVMVQNTTGGTFGYKFSPTMEALIGVAVLATGRPCHLRYNYQQQQQYTGKRSPFWTKVRMAANKKTGKIVAMETDWTCDHGPYSEFGDLLTLRGAQFIGAGYGIPNIRGDGRTVATNHAWGAAFRGYGGPESEFPSEVLMDELAEKLGMDPFDLREFNCYKEGDTTPTGQKPEVMNLPTMFKALRPKYEAAKAKAKAESTDAVKRGVGLALAVYGAGLDGPDSSEAWAELNPDGSVTIGSSWEDHGQGADSGAQCTAHEALRPLGLPVEKIRLVMNDTSKTPNSGPAGGSRSQVMTGNAIRVACEQLVEAMRKPDGGFYTYDEMKAEGRAVHQDGKWTAPARDCGKNCQGEPFCCYMYGLFMAEVAVEVATGKTQVEKMTMVADIGKVVNRLITDGQLYGGIAQGIGLALTEDYEDIKKHSTMAGAGIPTIKDIPDDLELIYVETPRPDGPFGASGTGEIPLCGPHPAIINAIYNACGARVTHLPAYPEKVLAAMPKK
ncbi:molybdopterin-dependent aldehyde oxidoreductase [uncultured Desulfovibrio sp.]|uniref:molybdopterin-dependent aldehyde oxidoreductase n=1 Tax=uncultured Desulfovibrio sp. TaxID=167968 RepID=UPI002804B427|nr:molybdopterin-dependent aldehyde oxidoreductase [uncultured Desulfovibrio sp.]